MIVGYGAYAMVYPNNEEFTDQVKGYLEFLHEKSFFLFKHLYADYYTTEGES